MGSGLPLFGSDDLSLPLPDGRRSSPGSTSRHRQQGETAADNISINKGSDSSPCVIVDVDGVDTETNDSRTNVGNDLLNSSVESVEIGLAGILDGELLSLPPPGEVFLPYRKQQQQHDVSPVPLIRASSSSNLDTAVFDFDVDEVDAMIGELVEEHDQEHEQNLTLSLIHI